MPEIEPAEVKEKNNKINEWSITGCYWIEGFYMKL